MGDWPEEVRCEFAPECPLPDGFCMDACSMPASDPEDVAPALLTEPTQGPGPVPPGGVDSVASGALQGPATESPTAPLAPHEMIHIAGHPVRVGHHVRQRCSWCGAVLVDQDMTRLGVPTFMVRPGDGEGPFGLVPVWSAGDLVAHDGVAWWMMEHEDGAVLPPGSCGLLDPAITGS